jgi:hypothetical protein
MLHGAHQLKTYSFHQKANIADLWENRAMEDSMPKRTRSKLNIRTEDARLRKSAAKLTRLTKKFATKWDRISNNGRVAIERSTARSLRAASSNVNRTNKRMGQILQWLDRVRQMDKAA